MKPLLAGVLLAAALAAGCASGSYSSPPSSSGPRARCLSNPNESGGMRPLIFFFCAESP